MNNLILLITALATALITGLFYGYSCSVNIGLGQLTDKEYLNAMQVINTSILNPWFFLSFTGTLLLLPISAWMQFYSANTIGSSLLLAATLIYIIGVFGVTAFGNVPLNEQLASANLQTLSVQNISAVRTAFEKPWLHYHQIRAWASIITLILVLYSCILINPLKTLSETA